MASEDTGYTDSKGHPLYFWVDAASQPWVCCEYDHGPMCRRCLPVDDILKGCLEAMVEGTMELVGPAAADQPPDLFWRMTEAGKVEAERIITETTDGFDMWRKLSGLEDPEDLP